MRGEKLPVLITGGAGFIGSHLANALAARGYPVRILDNLVDQVHGPDARFPAGLHPDVETLRGDVRRREDVRAALRDTRAVFHFAAAVGVGQSMYEIEHYTDVNNRGTAVLLECLLDHAVERLVVASSMSLYGEGLYRRGDTISEPPPRSRAQLRAARWELEEESKLLEPVPTPESKTPAPTSVYALSKLDQERLCLMFGHNYDVPAVALRFFNAYGPGQALSNPYTGVLAIFAARCLNGKPPMIFEDGHQRRDFVSVHDIVRGCILALEKPEAAGQAFNIGSGKAHSVLEIAQRLIKLLDLDLEPVIAQKYRAGDIRNCYADISLARRVLGYEPEVMLEAGLAELIGWLQGARAEDRSDTAGAELERRGLTL
ncbi:NAD-dependent epimerase/dehydratase family protein [soil metagenome]